MVLDWRKANKLATVVLDGRTGKARTDNKVKSVGYVPGIYRHRVEGECTYVGMSANEKTGVAGRLSAFKGSYEDPTRHEAHGQLYRQIYGNKKVVVEVDFIPTPGLSKAEIEVLEEQAIRKLKPTINCHHMGDI